VTDFLGSEFLAKIMRSISFLLFSLVAASVLEKRGSQGCAADNCLRALTGNGSNDKTARPVVAKSDCSSFMLTTAVVTVTPTM
jgi:hypothetical protein